MTETGTPGSGKTNSANHNLALRQLLFAEPSPIVCYRIVHYNETPCSAWTVSEANHTVPCCNTRCLRAVNVTCLELVYAKQPIIGLTNEFCWVRARACRRVAFETINYLMPRYYVLYFDINYHPNIAQINMQGASVLVLT